jgi:hypothetical protein
MWDVLLPPGVNPTAVKYIYTCISYIINVRYFSFDKYLILSLNYGSFLKIDIVWCILLSVPISLYEAACGFPERFFLTWNNSHSRVIEKLYISISYLRRTKMWSIFPSVGIFLKPKTRLLISVVKEINQLFIQALPTVQCFPLPETLDCFLSILFCQFLFIRTPSYPILSFLVSFLLRCFFWFQFSDYS